VRKINRDSRSLPSLQALQALDAAARHGSYTAAAAELGLTHGAISHRIRELEQRLQFRLFERQGRLMQPTREAMSLLAAARQALLLIEGAFPARRAEPAARLVVGVHPALASRWLVPRLGDFEAAAPGVALEIRSIAELGDFLAPGVDLAIRYGGGRWPDVHAEHLADEQLFPVCTPAYAQRVGLREPADLARCTLLRHAWQPWLPWLQTAGVAFGEPARGLLVSDSSMLIAAAASGAGVALAKARYAERDIAAGTLLRPFDIAINDVHSYYAIWRNGTRPDALAASFLDWLRTQFNPPAGHEDVRLQNPGAT
jgi:LysR family glycine cleavage system transcriptional activator